MSSIHDTKIGGYALWDIVGTGVIAAGIGWYFEKSMFWILVLFLVLIVISIPIHKIVGVSTKLSDQF